jgi:hypothetical protein
MSIESKAIKEKKLIFTNVFVFLFCIFIGGILFFILKKDKISINEKRKLSSFPQINFKNYINGSLADSIDFYYSDNFIYRNEIISIADCIKDLRGVKNNEIKFFKNDKGIKKIGLENNTKIDPSINIAVNDSQINQTHLESIDAPFENIKSVIICKKRAIQCFKGSKYAAKNFADMTKFYKKTFNNKLNIYCLAIPIGGDFYLPQKLNDKNEKEFIDILYKDLDTGVISVKAYEELEKHTKEYIQFNTDHHWTGLGAYYAYKAFCSAAGFTSQPLSFFTKKVIPNFLGTLFYYTKSDELKENIDSVEYYKVPFETKTYYYKNGIDNGIPSQLYFENARGGNSYGVYLGSDFPMIRCITPNKNGKKIVIIKDSYGNAFSHYLTSHYEEVIILDYRYFKGNLIDMVNKFKITDILFAHNVYVANSDFAVKQELNFLKGNAQKSQNK